MIQNKKKRMNSQRFNNQTYSKNPRKLGGMRCKWLHMELQYHQNKLLNSLKSQIFFDLYTRGSI